MKTNKTIVGLISLIAMSLSIQSFAASWDMPTPYPEQNFHTVNIIKFTEDIAEATGGELKINVHSAGSLFKHPEINKAVRGGQVPIGEFFIGLLANQNPIFGADTLPFLATDYENASKLWAAQKPFIEKLLDKQGLKVLFSVPWPGQSLYTKKPISKVSDLKGLKFRTYNATLEKFAKAAGSAPTQVEVPDIPQAFSTGRVEAMITSPSTGVNTKAWDFVTHYTDIQAWIPKNIVVVNKRAFAKLDKSVQESVLAAAAKAEERGWEMSRAEATQMVQTLKDNGMIVSEPSKELMSGLREIGEKMLDEWKTQAGEDGKLLIKAFSK